MIIDVLSYAGFLTIPRDGAGEAVPLLRKVHLLAIRMLFEGSASTSFERFRKWLYPQVLQRSGYVLEAAASPDVLPFLLTRDRTFVPHFLAALGTAPKSFVWDVPFGEVVISDRLVSFDPPARAMLIHDSGIEIELHSGAIWRESGGEPPQSKVLIGDVRFASYDTNPMSAVEGHPEKSGNALSLGGHSIDEWERALREALQLIACALPTWLYEFARVMRRLVPVGFDSERHLSASYREAPGIAYLTLHPDPLTMAEAIVHESQHTKLNVATWLDPVLHNGQSCWTSSPVRPDLRPLMGVLLALHAFVPVAVMHRVLAESGHPMAHEPRFEQRRREVLETNARGLAIVQERAQPTALGERIIDALAETHSKSMR